MSMTSKGWPKAGACEWFPDQSERPWSLLGSKGRGAISCLPGETPVRSAPPGFVPDLRLSSDMDLPPLLVSPMQQTPSDLPGAKQHPQAHGHQDDERKPLSAAKRMLAGPDAPHKSKRRNQGTQHREEHVERDGAAHHQEMADAVPETVPEGPSRPESGTDIVQAGVYSWNE